MRLNISFFAVISFFLTLYFSYFKANLFQGFPIILGSILCLAIFFINILYNLFENPTPTLPQTTLWFYRCNVLDERNPKLSNDNLTSFLNKFNKTEEEFIKEDLKQLFNLHLYQAHYNNLAKKTRRTFFIGVFLFVIFVFIQIWSMY